MLNKSYEVNFIMFVSISILILFRSVQDNLDKNTRLSLQLSSFVTIIASMHYFLMIYNKTNLTLYRYFDWFFTTPILLIDLCIMLDITDPYFLIEIVGYNMLMLLFGFLGELNILSTLSSTVLGFIPFIVLFYRIYTKLGRQHDSESTRNEKIRLLTFFIVLWSLYGINHTYQHSIYRNGIYNVLDFITKGMFGLYVYRSSWTIK